MTEFVIAKLHSHRNCVPGRCCVLLQVTAVPLSRQKMAELLSYVTPFLPVLSCVNPFHCFLSHALSSHRSLNTLFLLAPEPVKSCAIKLQPYLQFLWLSYGSQSHQWCGLVLHFFSFWLKMMFPLTASFFPQSLLYFIYCFYLCFLPFPLVLLQA